MKKTFLLLLLNFTLFSFSYGQATIKGKVTDKKNGETLIGVTISLESKPGVGVTTDLDGNYTLILPDASVQTLVISYISYETKKEVVHPVMGETIIKDFNLQSVSTDLGTIEVQAKATRAKEYYMENIKKNSSASIDFISSETMKKTGDINVTAAVTRVSGVSMSNGFISVRGISDRYVKTTINGSRIPTLDPFTNNIRLDLFPASLIDNVILTKTASPDLPGDWAGAYISLETKDYPDKFSINMETSVGYNAQTSFKDIISSPHSKTEWLGYDNGLREYDHEGFTSFHTRPTDKLTSESLPPYEQLVGLGLGNYLNSIGVNANTPWNDAYFVLGLVQLGLLDKELQTNDAAIKAAKNRYVQEGYQQRAFIEFTKPAIQSGQAFKNNWVPIKRREPLNFSQSFSIGNQTKFLGRTLGVVAGFRYGKGIQYDPSSNIQRVIQVFSQDSMDIDVIQRQLTKETNTWSALMNLAYKLNINNSVAFVFMPNFSGVNNVGSQHAQTGETYTTLTNSQFYEQRRQLVYQYKSEHFLPGPQLKLELNASYTRGKSDAPDYKDVNYREEFFQGVPTYSIGGEIGSISRYFRYLTDNIFDSRIAAECPFHNSTEELIRKLKFGVSYQNTYRKSDQYRYDVWFPHSGAPLTFDGDLQRYLDLGNFGIQTLPDGTPYVPAYYERIQEPENNSFGRSTVKGAFAMLDYSFLSFLRVTGGLRVEQADLYTDITKYDALHLKPNDPRRNFENNGIANPGKINDISYLPSANVIFKLKRDVAAPMNLRLNFSQTIARPSLREISPVSVFDYEYRTFVKGNSDLKTVQIKNYDLRFESYFKSGDNFSVSVFYKDFKNHIELVNFGTVTWQNVDKSAAMGIELEGRKSIFKNLEFRSNITLVSSKTTFVRGSYLLLNNVETFVPTDTITRTMFGQAPYILNGMLIYTSDSLGLSLTASYNIQGPRLTISSNTVEIPDIYELPRHSLDVKITKKLGKHFSTSLTVRDVLNQRVARAYKFDTWDVKYDSYRYGTNYVVGLSYQF